MAREFVSRERAFSVDTSTACDAVTPVDVDQLITGDLPEPELKRHERTAQVFGEAQARLEQNTLHHIAGVFTSSQRPIQSHGDQPAQGLAMRSQQPIDGGPVVARSVLEHGLSFSRVRPHRSVPFIRAPGGPRDNLRKPQSSATKGSPPRVCSGSPPGIRADGSELSP
jgi:hypothetical protein